MGLSEQVNYTYSGGGRRRGRVRLIKFWACRTLAAFFFCTKVCQRHYWDYFAMQITELGSFVCGEDVFFIN
jgi:hypothetical protein